jgi:hypothetical protein
MRRNVAEIRGTDCPLWRGRAPRIVTNSRPLCSDEGLAASSSNICPERVSCGLRRFFAYAPLRRTSLLAAKASTRRIGRRERLSGPPDADRSGDAPGALIIGGESYVFRSRSCEEECARHRQGFQPSRRAPEQDQGPKTWRPPLPRPLAAVEGYLVEADGGRVIKFEGDGAVRLWRARRPTRNGGRGPCGSANACGCDSGMSGPSWTQV